MVLMKHLQVWDCNLCCWMAVAVAQINKGFVNLTGRVIGNGNGSIHVTVYNVRNYYTSPQPLLPSYEQSMREYSSGPKLLKHDQLDNANTNGILLSKSSPSTGSSTTCNKPLLPSYEQSKEYGSEAKLLKHNQLDNANTNGILFSKPSPSNIISSTSQRTGEEKFICTSCHHVGVLLINRTSYHCSVCHAVSRKDSGAKLFKHDQLDNAFNTNGILLSKPSTSTGSSLSSSTTGNKRAVLCGVTYGKRKFRLKGTINDVVNMKELLVKNFNFPIQCIRVLTEEQQDPNLIPTRGNILESLKWLVKDCQPGDSLVFYISGHGLKQPDFNEDEIDETLCPVDFMKEGMITDHEINSTIVWPLKKGVTLHAIIDAGYSGTILDLMFVYNKKYRKWKDHNNSSTIGKHTSGGLAIYLSSTCEESQMACDSIAFGQNRMNGVLTHLLTKTMRDCPAITYGSLLDMMHNEIENINGPNSIMKRIFQRKVAQDPLLSSSHEFDVYTRIFTM